MRGESDWDLDGVLDTIYQTGRTFNRNGDVLVETQSYDWDGIGGFDRIDTITNEYNKRGDIILSQTDHGTDGTIDISTVYDYPIA